MAEEAETTSLSGMTATSGSTGASSGGNKRQGDGTLHAYYGGGGLGGGGAKRARPDGGGVVVGGGRGRGSGSSGADPITVGDEDEENEDEFGDDDDDDDEQEPRPQSEEDLDKPVGVGCYTKRTLTEQLAAAALADPPAGFEHVPWPDNKYSKIQAYGLLYKAWGHPPKKGKGKGRKGKHQQQQQQQEQEKTWVFSFRCMCDGICTRAGPCDWVTMGCGSIDALATGNVWRHLSGHGIYSKTGLMRKGNKEHLARLARLAAGSPLRGADPQRFFALQLVEALFIDKKAPFSWADDPKLRIFIKGINDYLRSVLPPDMAALVAQYPGFNVELFHNQAVKVRCSLLCALGSVTKRLCD